MICKTPCCQCIYRNNCEDSCFSDQPTTDTTTETTITMRKYNGTIYLQPAYQCTITDQLIDLQLLNNFGDAAFDNKVFLSHQKHDRFELYHGTDVLVASLFVNSDNVFTSLEVSTGWDGIQDEGVKLILRYIGYKFVLPNVYNPLGVN